MNTLEQITKLFGNNPEYRIKEDGNVVSVERYMLKDEYGVPMFKGDWYCWVNVTESQYGNVYVVNCPGSTILDGSSFNTPHTKIFASKESAERWIKENKPRTPIYVDPENGDKFFERDKSWFFDTCTYEVKYVINSRVLSKFEPNIKCNATKSYNTREKCEIALAEFIANKHGRKLNPIVVSDSSTNNHTNLKIR